MERLTTIHRPDPRLAASWCREGVTHDHQACGPLWNNNDPAEIEQAARWAADRAAERAQGEWMQTYTGRAFYLMAPAIDDVDPEDIAHALSLLCRYGGHVRAFYSVAEHCVLMSEAVAPENALWALLHDAAEAYVNDLIRPLKHSLPAYCAAENRIEAVICDRFGIGHQCPAEVKAADNRILRDERDALMGPPPLPWKSIEDVEPLGVPIVGWDPDFAKRRYLDRLVELTTGSPARRLILNG